MAAYATLTDLANAATDGWRELAHRGAPEAVLDSALALHRCCASRYPIAHNRAH